MSEKAKLDAARAALAFLPVEGVVGLGTGSTARLFIAELGKLVAAGRRLRGVPTSQASRQLAERLGIPLLDDDGPWDIAVCVDGADEVSADLSLIKGGGGALLREKIVSQAARANVIIVDESKLAQWLGERCPLPVEVARFGHRSTAAALAALGRPVLRESFSTDAGNVIYDVHCGPIADPAALDRTLHAVPGVVETGLFVGRASHVIVAGKRGVRTLP